MAVRATKSYTTSDGKIFQDYKKAQAHEKDYHTQQRKVKSQQLRLNKLKSVLLDPNLCQSSNNSLAIDLLNKPKYAEQLRDALNSVLEMHRNFSK